MKQYGSAHYQREILVLIIIFAVLFAIAVLGIAYFSVGRTAMERENANLRAKVAKLEEGLRMCEAEVIGEQYYFDQVCGELMFDSFEQINENAFQFTTSTGDAARSLKRIFEVDLLSGEVKQVDKLETNAD